MAISKMQNPFDSEGWYKPERDGSLEDYLKIHDGFFSFPLFKGVEIYERLFEMGFLSPNYSIIKVICKNKEEEHFVVVKEGNVKSLEAEARLRVECIYEAKDILMSDDTIWEVQHPVGQPKYKN